MRPLLLLITLTLGFGYAKAQSIVVYVTEKVKGAEIPVIRTDFDVLANDSLKKKVTSQADGSLPRIALYNGTHKITLKSDEFNEVTEKDILVKDYRTTEVTIYLTRRAQPKK